MGNWNSNHILLCIVNSVKNYSLFILLIKKLVLHLKLISPFSLRALYCFPSIEYFNAIKLTEPKQDAQRYYLELGIPLSAFGSKVKHYKRRKYRTSFFRRRAFVYRTTYHHVKFLILGALLRGPFLQ